VQIPSYPLRDPSAHIALCSGHLGKDILCQDNTSPMQYTIKLLTAQQQDIYCQRRVLLSLGRAHLLNVEREAPSLLPQVARHLSADLDPIQRSTQEGVGLLGRERLHDEPQGERVLPDVLTQRCHLRMHSCLCHLHTSHTCPLSQAKARGCVSAWACCRALRRTKCPGF